MFFFFFLQGVLCCNIAPGCILCLVCHSSVPCCGLASPPWDVWVTRLPRSCWSPWPPQGQLKTLLFLRLLPASLPPALFLLVPIFPTCHFFKNLLEVSTIASAHSVPTPHPNFCLQFSDCLLLHDCSKLPSFNFISYLHHCYQSLDHLNGWFTDLLFSTQSFAIWSPSHISYICHSQLKPSICMTYTTKGDRSSLPCIWSK